MFGISKTIGSIILAVVFLALAGLATFFYNLDNTGQADIVSNSLARKGKAAVDVVLIVSGKMADSNLESNTGFGNKMVTTARNFIENTDWKGLINGTKTAKESFSSSTENNTSVNNSMVSSTIADVKDMSSEITSAAAPIIDPNSEAPGFFSRLITGIKNEWNKIREEASYSNNKTEEIFNVKSETEENGTSAANQ